MEQELRMEVCTDLLMDHPKVVQAMEVWKDCGVADVGE